MASYDYTGKTLDDKYRVIQLLGEGGMGAVYLGEHMVIGKAVAVKFLHAELAMKEEVVKRFFREAQAAGAIRHPNIIDIMDIGVSKEGEPYLVMEYLEGEGLGDRLARTGPMDLPTTCGILDAVLAALKAAHEKGIVHRDLKPDNIFLVYRKGDPVGVKLIDFGISKFVASTDMTKLTQDGSMLGTPAYMSPEQARGLSATDHRTDLYAVGVIMYEMLAGGMPYQGSSYNELLLNVITTEPRSPLSLNPGFPTEALPVVEKSLCKDPDGRYQTASEMLDAVRALVPEDERKRKLTLASDDIPSSAAIGELGKSRIETSDTHLATDMLSKLVSERAQAASMKPKTIWQLIGDQQPVRELIAPLTVVYERVSTNERVGVVIGLIRRIAGVVRRHRALQGLSAAIAIAAVLSVGVALCSSPDGESVEIEVRGAPEGARIYYEDSLVPVNPFRVKRGDTLVPIRVEGLKGQTFKISIVPSKNQTVDVGKLDAEPDRKVGRTAAELKAAPAKDSPAKVDKASEAQDDAANKTEEEKKKTGKRRLNWLPWRRGAKSEP